MVDYFPIIALLRIFSFLHDKRSKIISPNRTPVKCWTERPQSFQILTIKIKHTLGLRIQKNLFNNITEIITKTDLNTRLQFKAIKTRSVQTNKSYEPGIHNS